MADTAPSKAPVHEVGYANPHADRYWSIDADLETVPELAWPESIRVFEKMERTDAQVGSVLKAVTLPIRATQWRIDPAGARPEVAEYIAAQLALPLTEGEAPRQLRRRSRFSWSAHLPKALRSLALGSAYFEQIVTVTPDRAAPNGHRVDLRKLAPRPARTLHDILVARDGGLIGIEQSPPAQVLGLRSKESLTVRSGDPVFIPVNRLVGYVHDLQDSNWAGTSILRTAYKHWLLKERLLRIETMAIDRNGVGIPDYEAPDEATQKDLKKGKEMANAYRAGDQSGLSRPHGSKFRLVGVDGLLMPARPAIEYHDAQIGRAVLAHFLNLDGKGGSYALASTQDDLFATGVTATAMEVRDTGQAHVVEDLVDWQFGPDEPAPQLVFDDIGSSDMAIAQALRTLVDSQVISPDGKLENWTRRSLGIPDAETS